MSDSELSLTVWKRKALVEKRIRDVETQMNEMCNLVFGDVIQLFSEEDRVKAREGVVNVIDNIIGTNVEVIFQKLTSAYSRIVQAASLGGIKPDTFASIFDMGPPIGNVVSANQSSVTQQANSSSTIIKDEPSDEMHLVREVTVEQAVPGCSQIKVKFEPVDGTHPIKNGPETSGIKRKLPDGKSALIPEKIIKKEDDDDSLSNAGGVIAIRLKCLADNCDKYFNYKEELDGHMLRAHRIKRHPCWVRNCGKSFASVPELISHRLNAHTRLGNQWPCAKCDQELPSSVSLSLHFTKFHEEGHFACAFTDCNFVSKTNRKAVHIHQVAHITSNFICPEKGCGKSLKGKPSIEAHLAAHRDEKPYICKWPGCAMASAWKQSVVNHVRTQHFKLPSTQKEQKRRGIVDNRNAHDYVLQL